MEPQQRRALRPKNAKSENLKRALMQLQKCQWDHFHVLHAHERLLLHVSLLRHVLEVLKLAWSPVVISMPLQLSIKVEPPVISECGLLTPSAVVRCIGIHVRRSHRPQKSKNGDGHSSKPLCSHTSVKNWRAARSGSFAP